MKKYFRQVTKPIPFIVRLERGNVEPLAQISHNDMNSVESKFRSVVVQNLGSLKANILASNRTEG